MRARAQLSAALILALGAPGEPGALALQAGGPGPSDQDGPERIELFPWEDPLTGFEPFELRMLIRARAVEEAEDPLGAENQRGFLLEDARLALSGEISDGVNFRVSLDGGDEGVRPAGEIELLEGWGSFELGERHSVLMGRFRRPFVRSAIVDQSTLLFFDRTVVGDLNNVYDVGARIDGRYEFVDLTLALQNGEDATANETRTTARAEFQLLGGGVPLEDALYRVERRHRLSMAIGYTDETSVDSGDTVALDAAWRYDRFGLAAELLDNGTATTASTLGGDRAWSITASWLPLPEEWVVGLRWQELDDVNDSRIISGVAKRYLVRGRIAGHFQIDRVDADDPDFEGWRFTIGSTLTF